MVYRFSYRHLVHFIFLLSCPVHPPLRHGVLIFQQKCFDLRQLNACRRQADEGIRTDGVDFLLPLNPVFDAPVGTARWGDEQIEAAAFATKALRALSESFPEIPPAMSFLRVRSCQIPPRGPDGMGFRGHTLDGNYREEQKETPSLGRRWMLLEVFLVEAAGIEPASASSLPSVLHV